MATKHKILTANRLDNGAVVYFGQDGQWSLTMADAVLSANDADEAALIAEGDAALASQVVIDPYLIPVEIENGVPVVQSKREEIRAAGPSIASDYSAGDYSQNSRAAIAAAEGLSS